MLIKTVVVRLSVLGLIDKFSVAVTVNSVSVLVHAVQEECFALLTFLLNVDWTLLHQDYFPLI